MHDFEYHCVRIIRNIYNLELSGLGLAGFDMRAQWHPDSHVLMRRCCSSLLMMLSRTFSRF